LLSFGVFFVMRGKMPGAERGFYRTAELSPRFPDMKPNSVSGAGQPLLNNNRFPVTGTGGDA
jgi:hypothetical protein